MLTLYLTEAFKIGFLILFSIFLTAIIILLALYVGSNNPDVEKVSSYECGFDPYKDARNKFEVRFYLVAILFIIFDLEISFLFPWCITLGKLSSVGFWSMMIFLIILTVGFIYEWQKGALEWE